MRTFVTAPLALAAVLTGCRGEHRILEDHCALMHDEIVATLTGPAVDDVVLAGEPPRLAWSERAGLFVAEIDGSAARSLGRRCDGGLAASGNWLACSRRGDDAKADPGRVTVYDLRSLAPLASWAGVGPDGDGVALAGDTGIVVWNRARTDEASVWHAQLGVEAEPRRLSRPGMRAGVPAVFVVDDEPTFVWPETWANRDGRLEGELLVRRGEGPARRLEELAYDGARPTLQRGADGEAVLVFRDRRPAGTRPHLYVRQLGANEGAREGVHANSDGESRLVHCGRAIVAIAPRTHSRDEQIISVRRHDAVSLEGSGPEHQIYAHGTAFTQADARCIDGELLIAAGTHATSEHPAAAIHTVRFRCDEADGD